MPKILLVEDNEVNRDMLSRRFLRRRYEVTLAVDGAQTVASSAEQRPDLALLDLSLPVVDGCEATRRIKSVANLRHIPIIALTAHTMSGEEVQAKAAGCDDFASKPVELEPLLQTMADCLAAAWKGAA